MEPFRIRITASSSGTLDAVIVKVTLVDNAKNQQPDPEEE